MPELFTHGDLVRRYLLQLREMYGDQIYVDRRDDSSDRNSGSSLAAKEAGICQCQKCPLGSTRTKFVFGVGAPDADLVFVGEAPGREEDLKGEPFVGKAGQLLDRILAAIKLTRHDVYICNVLKCRPPNNRTPTAYEIETCFPYLQQQIEIIGPRLIVTLGATSAQALLGVKTSLAQLRSKLWKFGDFNLVATYHPAALLRNPSLKRSAWEDFQWIQSLVQGD